MIDQLLNDSTIILILAGLIFGLMGGIAITCLALVRYEPKAKQAQPPRVNSIRLWKPSRQRRETLKRATHNAKLFVMGGTIDFPSQRRRA